MLQLTASVQPACCPLIFIEGVMLVTALETKPGLMGAVTHTCCTFTGTLNDTFKWHEIVHRH